MSNIKEPFDTTITCWTHFKNIFSLLRQGKTGASLREVYYLFKAVYFNHIKGKYVMVKGHKIPRLAILIVALIGIYCVVPTGVNEKALMSGKSYINSNEFNYKGLRVYDLKKCNGSACGLIENDSDNTYERIRATLVFYTQTGDIVAEGSADAEDMTPHVRKSFEINCPEDFAYFKLEDVLINPKK